MGYASQSGTGRNMSALKAAGWGVVVSPFDERPDIGLPFLLDNPAWPVSQLFEKGLRETRVPNADDLERFRGVVTRRGARADLIVVPDIVLGGAASLSLSEEWLPALRALVPPHSAGGPRMLIAVQDGMDEAGTPLGRRARQLIGQADGIFVGGGDPWKENSLPVWAALKRETGCYMHVGRVNTTRRVALCAAANAESIDGTSASRFSKNLPKLDGARRQPSLIGFGG